MCYQAPELFGRLVDILVSATTEYLSAQIDGGAEAIMLFDSWAGLLPPPQFEKWVVEPTQRIVASLKRRHSPIPVVGFPRLASLAADTYASRTKVDCVAIDTSADLSRVSERLPAGVALQGNLDPLVLLSGGSDMMMQAHHITSSLRGRPHVFNLGHGVLPTTPPEHVAELVQGLRSQ